MKAVMEKVATGKGAAIAGSEGADEDQKNCNNKK
jgi:hypothetical protein